MDPTRALARLRDPSDPALTDLAWLIVADSLATPLRDLASARFLASQLAAGLQAATRGPDLRDWALRQLEASRARAAHDPTPAGEDVPQEVTAALEAVLGKPYLPDEELLFRLIDQPAMRSLVRKVLTDTVTGFRNRIADLEGMLGGLGRQARSRPGSLFRNLEGMAQNIVGAVREEVDAAFEARIKEFVEGATQRALRSIASYLAHPSHADAFAEMRVGILGVLLDTSRATLAGEVSKFDAEGAIDAILESLRASAEAEGFVARLEGPLAESLDAAGDGTFGAWLDEVGLTEVWSRTAVELIVQRLRAVVSTDGFAAWWLALHAASPRP